MRQTQMNLVDPSFLNVGLSIAGEIQKRLAAFMIHEEQSLSFRPIPTFPSAFRMTLWRQTARCMRHRKSMFAAVGHFLVEKICLRT